MAEAGRSEPGHAASARGWILPAAVSVILTLLWLPFLIAIMYGILAPN
jgi:hypothetical protein